MKSLVCKHCVAIYVSYPPKELNREWPCGARANQCGTVSCVMLQVGGAAEITSARPLTLIQAAENRWRVMEEDWTSFVEVHIDRRPHPSPKPQLVPFANMTEPREKTLCLAAGGVIFSI